MKFFQVRTLNNRHEGEEFCYFNYEFCISKLRKLDNKNCYKVNFPDNNLFGEERQNYDILRKEVKVICSIYIKPQSNNLATML